MPIIGIDREKCTNCRSCIPECVTLRFGWNDKTKEVLFYKNFGCILCGHCVAICPIDAIQYEDMPGRPFEFEEIRNIGAILPYENFNKLVRSKRSIRQYKKERVPKPILNKVIESMRYAPTGVNIRNLKLTVVSGNKVQQLSEAILKALLASPEVDDGNKLGFRAKISLGKDPIFHKSPHVMIIHSHELELVNATIAITHGMLAAETLGLGTCWIGWAQGPLNALRELRKNYLGFKDYVSGVFTIGFPDVRYKRSPTRPEIETNWLNDE
ncbi:MAG: nitroreductase family protein [Promethearchaeota archaeon]|jgi:nitroreductase/NAD-dependent dihydropyrimidine dehydrogenase PreA subunit